MELREFHNGMRILLNMEREEFRRSVSIDGKDWERFIADPLRYFIRCDDETAYRLWAIIEKRNTKRAA